MSEAAMEWKADATAEMAGERDLRICEGRTQRSTADPSILRI
jgi:hypothetical protein